MKTPGSIRPKENTSSRGELRGIYKYDVGNKEPLDTGFNVLPGARMILMGSELGLFSPLRYNTVITFIDGVKQPRCTKFFFWSPILFSVCTGAHWRGPFSNNSYPFSAPGVREKRSTFKRRSILQGHEVHEAWTRDLACPLSLTKEKKKEWRRAAFSFHRTREQRKKRVRGYPWLRLFQQAEPTSSEKDSLSRITPHAAWLPNGSRSFAFFLFTGSM